MAPVARRRSNVTLTAPMPPDPFWLLRVHVERGEAVPFHLWLMWAYQFTTPKGLSA